MTRDQKLEQFAERELKRNIDSLIIDDGTGCIVVFGKYYIEPVDTRFQVSTWDKVIHCFSSKKTAMSWCTADCQAHYNLSNMILVLDRKKQALAADIYCRKTLGERGRTETFYEIINMKIQPKIDLYTSVVAELEKCVNQAKYMQIRGFNNETARTIGSNAK
jgi:hypothetical protein